MTSRKKKLRNRNRTWDAPTHVWVLSTRLACVVVLFVMGLIVHAVLQHNCRALNRDLAQLESDQRRLTEDLARARSHWADLKTPSNLERALHRHGMAMHHPSARQVVHMTPVPGGMPSRAADHAAYAAR